MPMPTGNGERGPSTPGTKSKRFIIRAMEERHKALFGVLSERQRCINGSFCHTPKRIVLHTEMSENYS